MRIEKLIEGLPVRVVAGRAEADVADITDDSRRVMPGWLFAARPGTADDGARYIDDAMSRGAAAAVACDATTLATLAERVHGEPSKRLTLIGVTGTNGKTTVAYMIRHLLNATGGKCGMMTTIEVDDGSAKPQAAALTTPGSCEISRVLARMVTHGCETCVMECSSHALHQGRCDALDFDVAVFTNLSGDHLDYHGTMQAYAAAKARLFGLVGDHGRAVINRGDDYHRVMADACAGEVVTFHPGQINIIDRDTTGSTLEMPLADGAASLRFPLIGRHNVANLAAACGAVDATRGSIEAIQTMPPAPGRLERVSEADAPFTVLVDYAHTDDALRNVLEALRPLVQSGAALRVLFGCGGDRDRTKRPRMAAAACELADTVVVTSDNPRTERPQTIIDDILEGVPDAADDRVTTIVDRREAIDCIIRGAGEGDIVLIAGKGHEDYQIIGTTRQPFDDRVEARRVLGLLKQGQRQP